MIPFADLKRQYQKLKEEIDSCINDALSNTAFIGGKPVSTFEESFSKYIGVNHCISCANGTDSIEILLKSLGIKEGDEVLVPAISWISTSEAVSSLGATPVFVDIDPSNYTIDVNQITAKITSKTKAIIVVHLFGLCAPMDEIKAITGDIPIVEDGACAVGSAYNNVYAGGLGTMGCFSFHPRKSITTGEGGMITTNDDKLASKIHILRNHGSSVSEEQRHNGPKPYILPDFNVLGYNYRMTDLQGAIGLVQLAKLNKFIKERSDFANFYKRELREVLWIRVPKFSDNYLHSWQSFVILIDESKSPFSRNRIMEKLQENGISTRPGTHAVHMLGYYSFKLKITLISSTKISEFFFNENNFIDDFSSILYFTGIE